ncbi:arginine--tRNA ligase [Helicobacter monodelphidis]|uniref:arginine--tRNA ligase n=1 Tax=Helicobacter sp. 15-1451 TaxID=2004995 RepID=UPI000DCE3AF5|nr:arginine--tRNA ligase [Helicobacter sp. 15-1451]RAX57395.1 arginine--tRNA ligase [Helicobacter sp. 15-1451]
MHNQVKQQIAQVLSLDAEKIILERPKDQKFGHYATPISFVIAKEKKQNPNIIAEGIVQTLLESPLKDSIFAKIQAVGGFINFTLSAQFLCQLCDLALESGEHFGKQQKDKKILLEFVSANPTGPLHIGHARGAVLGDSLASLGRHLGYQITTEYYVNDAGNQIFLLGLSVYLAVRESLGLDVEYPEQFYRGEYILEIAKKALCEFGEEFFHAESNIPIISSFAKDLMLQEIQQNLAQIGITFDSYVSEKTLYTQWDSIKSKLLQNGGIYEQDSKIWIKSESFGDEKDRVVVRESGEPTYLAGDIIYHHDKFNRHFEHYINIWGADHHGYITRVKAAISLLGFDSSKLEVLLSQMVTLLKGGEPYKMSKRAGNFILMSDVISEVGADVLRFVFLSKKNDTHLEFDVEDFKREDSSNPIYYIHYAYARIHTLFERSQKTQQQIRQTSLEKLFSDETIKKDAQDLLFLSLQLSQVIEDAFTSRNLVKMSDYLKNLANVFHRFYTEHRVIQTPLELELLKLCQMVALSLNVGLGLLGIQAKTSLYRQGADNA